MNEQEKEIKLIDEENSQIEQKLRVSFLSIGQNQVMKQNFERTNSFSEHGDEQSLFSYRSIGINDPDNIRYKKKWAFHQLKKMSFQENNIIFALERIQNIEQLSQTEVLQTAANNIPDEMHIFESQQLASETQSIINKAKQYYQMSINHLTKRKHSSLIQHNQETFPTDFFNFNKKNNIRERRAQSTIIQYDKSQKVIPNFLSQNQCTLQSSYSKDLMQCAICCEQFQITEQLQKLSCDHQFCDECLYQYILNKINCGSVLTIVCPQENCGEEYTETQIKNILKDEHQIQRYILFKQRQQLQQDPSIRWCIRAGCSNAIKGQKNNPKLTCSECQMEMCYFCTNQWHEGLTCEQAIDEDYKKMAKNFKVKLCPSCKSKIQKNDGCNHMTCPRCQYQFCWLCTKKYNSNHFSNTNIRGCPGLMYSATIPPCLRVIVLGKLILQFFAYLLLGILAFSLTPVFIVLCSMSLPTILYFVVKKEYNYYNYYTSLEVLKVFILIILGIATFPISLLMAVFPGMIIGIIYCFK